MSMLIKKIVEAIDLHKCSFVNTEFTEVELSPEPFDPHVKKLSNKQLLFIVSREVNRKLDDVRKEIENQQMLNGRAYHLDHIKPVAEGGEHTAKNIVLSCEKCNLSQRKRKIANDDDIKKILKEFEITMPL